MEKVTAIEEIRDLNTMPSESLINSLTFYELKLKSKVQEEKVAKVKKSIALKTSQDENHLLSKFLQFIFIYFYIFMALGDNEVSTRISFFENDVDDDNLKYLVVKLHDSLKVS